MVLERGASDIGDNRNLFVEGTTFQFSSPHDTPTASVPVAFSEEEERLAHLTFNNVTWIASHNSHANNFAADGNVVYVIVYHFSHKYHCVKYPFPCY